MNSSNPFGIHLRRARVHRGISLDEIARQTNVHIELWEDLERDDFNRWPSGIYARQWIDAYAKLVGLDPTETVNEFCRVCPQADRRSESLMRGHANILGHVLAWQDDVPASGDRREAKPGTDVAITPDIRWLRVAVAALDFMIVSATAGFASLILPIRAVSLFALLAGLYHGVSMGALGCSPTVWLLENYGRAGSLYRRSHALAFRRLAASSKH